MFQKWTLSRPFIEKYNYLKHSHIILYKCKVLVHLQWFLFSWLWNTFLYYENIGYSNINWPPQAHGTLCSNNRNDNTFYLFTHFTFKSKSQSTYNAYEDSLK